MNVPNPQAAFDRGMKKLIARHPFLKVDVDWGTGVAILAHLQLAMRHPDNDGLSKDLVRKFCDQLVASIEQVSPELAACLRMGDDPQHDVPKENR